MSTLPQSEYHLSPLPAKPLGGVLVLHAWWGLTPFFKTFSDRLAEIGFVVIAPDLYHGKVAGSIEEAQKLRSMLKTERVEKDVREALRDLNAHFENIGISAPHLGVVGFSMGAHRALWLADQPGNNISATVLFYGTRGGDYLSTHSAFLGHFAESDPYVSKAGIEKLQKQLQNAGHEALFYQYSGTSHWFFEEDRPDAFNFEAATLAWERTVEFLLRQLSSEQRAHVAPSLPTQSPRKPSRGS
ncbi:MAG: dienelactone hydrolase family protein [Anaerolineae bacterium]|nr:dienelactone hydrolase family protein [Anaerolineae bacterium]